MAGEVYWKRLVAEGFAIVLSILLAFGVDAWWEARSERELARHAVSAPRAEPPSDALDELIATGRLSLIDDRELRKASAAWPPTVSRLNEKMNLHESFVYEQLVPEMRAIMPLRVVADSRYDSSRRPETVVVVVTEEFVDLLAHLRLMVHRTLNSSGEVPRV